MRYFERKISQLSYIFKGWKKEDNLAKNNERLNNKTKNILDNIVKLEKLIIFITGIFIIFTIFIQVIFRYVFSSPLVGLEEIALLVVSWFYFIGAAYSVRSQNYIKADVLNLFIKNVKIKKVLNIFCHIISVIVCLILFIYGFNYAIWSYKNNVVSPHFLISTNFGFSALVIGSLLMIVHFIQLIKEEIHINI